MITRYTCIKKFYTCVSSNVGGWPICNKTLKSGRVLHNTAQKYDKWEVKLEKPKILTWHYNKVIQFTHLEWKIWAIIENEMMNSGTKMSRQTVYDKEASMWQEWSR